MSVNTNDLATVLAAQTVFGLLIDNWFIGAAIVLGFLIGAYLARSREDLRKLILPTMLAISWGLVAGHFLAK